MCNKCVSVKNKGHNCLFDVRMNYFHEVHFTVSTMFAGLKLPNALTNKGTDQNILFNLFQSYTLFLLKKNYLNFKKVEVEI